MRTLGKVAVVPTIASALVAAGTTAAHADSWNYTRIRYTGGPFNGGYPAHYLGGNIRSGPGTGRWFNGYGQPGQAAVCYSYTPNGQAFSGNPRWSYCVDEATSVQGWTWSPRLAPGF
jgi:hypothetical protein